jgi:hypothetical protein
VSGQKPPDIPSNPMKTYQSDGWIGMGDWLGTGRVADSLRNYRPFTQARNYVRGLGLKAFAEWREYCKSGKKPEDIPAHPYRTYADDGWINMADWLGAEIVATYQRQYMPFRKARAFVRSIGIKSQREWRGYSKSDKKPDNIPANPDQVYAGKGWVSLGDWLGTGTIAPRLKEFLAFKKARAFVRKLNLKSEYQWRYYCKSGEKPDEIPSTPSKTYKYHGWDGMGWVTGLEHGRLLQD